MIVRILVAMAMLAALSGCTSFQQSTYAKACANSGYPADHPQHAECIKNTAAADRDPLQLRTGEVVTYDDATNAAIYVATQPVARPAPAPVSGSAERRLCPNGQYVYGDACYIAPDGTYVGGPPRLAPNGQYVGGYGQLAICPNGSYVVGTRCRLMPDGTYVGE